MPMENAIFQTFSDLSTNLLRDVYLPGLYDIAFKKKRSWFMNRIPKNSDGVDGATVKIGFRTGRGWSWRPMGEFGYTPTGSPGSFAKQSFTLGCHAATVQVTETEMMACNGQASPIKNLLDDKLREVSETFPYYLRAMLWTPASGVMGQVVSVNGLIITLDNVGLWNTVKLTGDICKLFEPDMYIQILTSAGVKRGNPIKIVSVDKALDTITVSSDPGIADNDLIVIADIAGLENGYNASSPGIFDVIDDDNTFQGVNRALAANSKFRALVQATGSPRAITRALLTKFLHDSFDPEKAFTNYRVIERYYDVVVDSKQMYSDIKIVDGYASIQIQKTLLVEDDDADTDKIVVPDFGNMYIAEGPGGIKPLFGEGWKQIAGRPFMEYNFAYWASLVAKDCRYMAVLKDLSLTV